MGFWVVPVCPVAYCARSELLRPASEMKQELMLPSHCHENAQRTYIEHLIFLLSLCDPSLCLGTLLAARVIHQPGATARMMPPLSAPMAEGVERKKQEKKGNK